MVNSKLFDWKKIVIILGLGLIATYPIVGGDNYIMHIFILFFIWATVASSWNLLMGYAGIFSLGNIGYFAIGGYTSGILCKTFGWSPFICILLGGAASMVLVTLFVGLPALRLSGVYIALLSLIFADSLPSILTQTRSISGGAMGLHDIPPLFDGITRLHSYYINFTVFLGMSFIIYKTIGSKTGLAFMALRDAKEFATTLGINEYKAKIKVFALVSFITGTTGGFYVHYLGDISPTTLAIEPFLLTIAMIELGGIGRFPGAILGALFIVFGNEFLRLAGTLRLALLGALICCIILFFPGGLMQLVDRIDNLLNRFRQRKSGLHLCFLLMLTYAIYPSICLAGDCSILKFEHKPSKYYGSGQYLMTCPDTVKIRCYQYHRHWVCQKDNTLYWDRKLESAARLACNCELPPGSAPASPAVSGIPSDKLISTKR